MPTIHFGAIQWKEKLPMVFTQGKGLKIDPLEFSTHSLGLPISNPEGSIFRSFSLLFFCFWSSPFIYISHHIHHFQAFFCVRLFSTCSINTIIKTKKSMVPMPTKSFLNHYFRQEHASHGLDIHHRKLKHQCFSCPLSPTLNHQQPLMVHVYQELTFVLCSS